MGTGRDDLTRTDPRDVSGAARLRAPDGERAAARRPRAARTRPDPRATSGSLWCLAAVDQSIGVLSSALRTVPDADGLGPRTARRESVRAEIDALLRSLGDVPTSSIDDRAGPALAALLVSCWMRRRDRYLAAPDLECQAVLLDLLVRLRRATHACASVASPDPPAGA
jgi:hypothetical protein